VGNLEYKGDSLKGDTDFVYNSLNQLIRSTFAGVETLYTYDDNGSLKTRKTGDKTITYDWENDGENRLVGVEIVEGNERTEIEYEYNENGIRVGKTVDGVETSYLIDELQPYAQVLEEYDASGNLQAAYTYGEDLISRNGQFYHKDGLGSTRLLTDAFGGVSESYNYDAYGNLITGDGSENPYLFAGEQRDVETGLDYLRARYYDSTLGRFISRDAYQGSLNDPMSQHKYQYAHANPVVNTDPSGYATFTQIAAASAFLTTLAGLSYTTGAAGAVLADGGSLGDAVALYDQFFAGMLDSLTVGTSTLVRRLRYGEEATRNHRGLFFTLGRYAGGIASVWILSLGPKFSDLAAANWVGKAIFGYDLFGTAIDIGQVGLNVLQNKSTWWDIVPLLPVLGVFNNKVPKGLPSSNQKQRILQIKRGGEVIYTAPKGFSKKDLPDLLEETRESAGVVRERINGKVKGGTVGVGVTDIPGLETRVFDGGSPNARRPNAKDSKIQLVEGTDPIKSPFDNPQAKNHAEEGIFNKLDAAIESNNIDPNSLDGRTLYVLLEQTPCRSCRSALRNKKTSNIGVISKFSSKYPKLKIEITDIETDEILIIQGGSRIN